MGQGNLASICDFIESLRTCPVPDDVLDAVKKSLVDWFAVCAAALDDRGSQIVRDQVRAWNTSGEALSFYGDRGAGAPIAMINATMSHALDYDDVHLDTAFHASGPTLAVAFALAMERGFSELDIIRSYLAGFEIGASLGEHGLGVNLAHKGWHPTSILGSLSAAAAATMLLGLDRKQTAMALGLAAAQAGGLMATGGTMAKPFQVGRAAMSGVLSAELAARGLDAPSNMFDDDTGGLLPVLMQGGVQLDLTSLLHSRRIFGNGFKPYAACQLTHAAFEAAKKLSGDINDPSVRSIRVTVNPLAPKVARHTHPSTPVESKFSLSYVVALGLLNYDATPLDFTPARLAEPRLRQLSNCVEIVPRDEVERWSAKVELLREGAASLVATSEAALGSPARPLGWTDLESKFVACTEPVYGARHAALFSALQNFEKPGQLALISSIMGSPRAAT